MDRISVNRIRLAIGPSLSVHISKRTEPLAGLPSPRACVSAGFSGRTALSRLVSSFV